MTDGNEEGHHEQVPEFTREEMQGSRFEDVDFTGARFHNVDLTGAKISGALLVNVDISGLVDNVSINGVEVGPLIEAELDRRHPERAKLRPSDADGFREAWDVIERSWQPTVERARRLKPKLLHERVDGEWSFIETLRHLIFATDAWVKRAMLGDPSPYDLLDLPHAEMGDVAGVPHDPDARPTLDHVLALRADRMAVVREVVAGLTNDVLAGATEPPSASGYPPAGRYPVRRCLQAVLNEEWAHRIYAERDLAELEARS
jgi:DinB superfamily/Pentapeptide repeats (8 copies)